MTQEEVMEQVRTNIFKALEKNAYETDRIEAILSIPELKEGLELYLKEKSNESRTKETQKADVSKSTLSSREKGGIKATQKTEEAG